MNLLLFLIAWLLFLPATLVNVIIVASKSGTRGWVRALGGYFRESAVRLDRYGCGEFRATWNVIMITKDGIPFRADGNTISAYLGANQIKGTLRGFGRFIAWLLDKVDKGHCLRAYEKRVAEIEGM